MMGGSAPNSDPRIGRAAMHNARTGEEALEFMRSQADTTNRWARQDRRRYRQTFEPLQDDYIERAQNWANPRRTNRRIGQAQADVSNAFASTRDAQARRDAAMGVTPGSGASRAEARRSTTDEAMARAGAANMARSQVRAEGDQMEANAINLGSGLGVNPATSMGLSNSAGNAGFGAAMQGHGSAASILQGQDNYRMGQWQANQAQRGGIFGALGSVAGALPWATMLSDETKKKDIRKPRRAPLEVVKEIPVKEWTYKSGEGDGGRHVGPMAQDMKKATGRGDGRRIDIIDAIGLNLGATQDLAEKVTALERKVA